MNWWFNLDLTDDWSFYGRGNHPSDISAFLRDYKRENRWIDPIVHPDAYGVPRGNN